jgi:hypothetical protein
MIETWLCAREYTFVAVIKGETSILGKVILGNPFGSWADKFALRSLVASPM